MILIKQQLESRENNFKNLALALYWLFPSVARKEPVVNMERGLFYLEEEMSIAIDDKKQCSKCNAVKDVNEFYYSKDTVDKLTCRCKVCHHNYTVSHKSQIRLHNQKYWILNRDKLISKSAKNYKETKQQVFDYYGGKCECCGETNYKFLTLDHIEQWKRKLNKYKGVYLYPTLIKRHFPKYIRLLCWNCNCSRQYNNGICPHKTDGIGNA